MKNLPNDRFNLVESSFNPLLFDRIDFKNVATIESPSCLVFKNGFTSSITVGFHSNVIRLVSELILTGYESFTKYVENFTEYYGVDLPLLSILKENYTASSFDSVSIYDKGISNLLNVLSKNKLEVLEFINLLKKFRPKEVSISLNSFKDLERSEYKFFISYVELYDINITDSLIYPINNQSLVGSFNLDLDYHVPKGYDELVKDLATKLDALGLEYTISTMIDTFKKVNDNIFESQSFNFMVYSMPMVYGFVYDIIFERIKGLVSLDVNER